MPVAGGDLFERELSSGRAWPDGFLYLAHHD